MTTTQFSIIEEEGPDSAVVFVDGEFAFTGTTGDCREYVLSAVGVELLAAPEGFFRSIRGTTGALRSLRTAKGRIEDIKNSVHW